MKRTDKCWVLGNNHGVILTTLSKAVDDVMAGEFFTTESEAWEAEAKRASAEADRYDEQAYRYRARAREALEKAKAARITESGRA